jgi:hypothetical protein
MLTTAVGAHVCNTALQLPVGVAQVQAPIVWSVDRLSCSAEQGLCRGNVCKCSRSNSMLSMCKAFVHE